MLYHYAFYLKATVPGVEIGTVLFGGGYAGVDIFFIISGFIIVHSTEKADHANPVDFSIRRFIRVVPLAQIATLFYFAIVATRPPSRLLWQSLFFLPSATIDPPQYGLPVVPQEWTLAYELIFYGLFACVLIFTRKRRVIVATVVILASMLGFQWVLGRPFSLDPNSSFAPASYHGILPAEILEELGNPIMLDFVVGMALAAALRRYSAWLRTEPRKTCARVIGLCVVSLFLFSYFSPHDPGYGLHKKGAGAACLVTGGLLIECSFRRPFAAVQGPAPLKVLLWLGAISFPLYLLHFGIAERILRFLCGALLGIKVGGIWGFTGLVATSLVLAALVHAYVEEPLIRSGKWVVAHRACRRTG
jgi:exopolysaccharide production protein ExoZ